MKYKHIVFDIDGTLIDTEYAVINSLIKTIYCCPIKFRKRDTVWLERRFYSVRVFLFVFLSPLAKKRWFRRCSGSLGKNDFPFLFGVVEQTVEIDVVHQCYPDHSSQS